VSRILDYKRNELQAAVGDASDNNVFAVIWSRLLLNDDNKSKFACPTVPVVSMTFKGKTLIQKRCTDIAFLYYTAVHGGLDSIGLSFLLLLLLLFCK
jgi:hypothetical protein